MPTARAATTVPVPPDRAFAVFADLAAWWPAEYTWSQDALVAIRMDPRAGGLCSEEGPHGFRCDWGRVLAFEPPARLRLTWQIGPDRVPQPDPARASEVEVRFTADGAGGTRVEVEHDGFERHGEGGAGYAAGMEPGWAHLLERYAGAL